MNICHRISNKIPNPHEAARDCCFFQNVTTQNKSTPINTKSFPKNEVKNR